MRAVLMTMMMMTRMMMVRMPETRTKMTKGEWMEGKPRMTRRRGGGAMKLRAEPAGDAGCPGQAHEG